MSSPYNPHLQQIQQRIHQQLINGLIMNTTSSMLMLPAATAMPLQVETTPKKRQLEITEPIVVEESEDEDDEEQRTLFVANLDDRVSEELLYEVFLQAGPIERARIPKDKDNGGRQRTYGFITYSKRCSPPYAMHLLQGLSLFRKSLTIKHKGKLLPPPMKSPVFGTRKSYDNSSLRSGNFSSYNDNKRMMDNSSPSGSSRNQERISKHVSNQLRPHSNSGPYHHQRRDSPNNYDKWRHNNNNNNNNHNNNNNNHNNNNGNRYSDNRSGKYRR